MIPHVQRRQALIALNSGARLSRDSICKLALRLEDWWPSREPSPIQPRQLGVPPKALDEARRLLEKVSARAAAELESACAIDARVTTLDDPSYPDPLHDLDLPPPVLYCQGTLPDKPAIAIVGARRASSEGTETAELFGRELAGRGIAVISGFANGIDHAAHRGALASGVSGSTVAILGCGLGIDYPRRRRAIRAEIARHGALVSEFPMTAAPSKLSFPIRNRLIAALTLGTLVVQGARRSGSLITARLAADLGRDVYAVPGSIYDPKARGPNALIQDGALLVTHPDQIVESLPVRIRSRLESSPARRSRNELEGLPGLVFDALSPGQATTAEHVAATTDLPLDQILGALLELEIDGRVKRFPGATFRRRP